MRPNGPALSSARAFAKFSEAGVYTTTVTQPAEFRAYLLEQLEPLVTEYGATIEVGVGAQEIPYPYVIESGDELTRGGGADAAELARFFPGAFARHDRRRDRGRRVRLRARAAARPVRRAARRLFAPPPRALYRLRLAGDAALGAAHQLPPLCRPVRAMGPEAAACGGGRRESHFARQPGHRLVDFAGRGGGARGAVAWHRFQMPAYHCVRADGRGISLVNIGVGPSNAKTITDHIAVLASALLADGRPLRRAWQSQVIGDMCSRTPISGRTTFSTRRCL